MELSYFTADGEIGCLEWIGLIFTFERIGVSVIQGGLVKIFI